MTRAARIRRARNVSILALPLSNIPAFVFDPLSLLATVPLSLAAYAILDRATTKAELTEISNSMEQLSNRVISLWSSSTQTTTTRC